MNPNKHFIAAQPAALTYSSTQATNCAVCGKHRHTPLRIDAMGGYICLTCIDHKLCEMLGEFGYSAPQKPMPDDELDLLCEKALFGRVSYQQLARSVEQHHGIGIPSPAWCASVDAEMAATAEADVAQWEIEHASCTLCAGLESPGFYTGCMIKDKAIPGGSDWSCDGRGNLARIKPASSESPTLPAAAVAEGAQLDGESLEQAE